MLGIAGLTWYIITVRIFKFSWPAHHHGSVFFHGFSLRRSRVSSAGHTSRVTGEWLPVPMDVQVTSPCITRGSCTCCRNIMDCLMVSRNKEMRLNQSSAPEPCDVWRFPQLLQKSSSNGTATFCFQSCAVMQFVPGSLSQTRCRLQPRVLTAITIKNPMKTPMATSEPWSFHVMKSAGMHEIWSSL